MAQILIVGRGGREHAIAKQMLLSSQVNTVYCAPGNPGMMPDGIQLVPIEEMDFSALISFAQSHEISLTFVGPENPLAAGIVDQFHATGLRVFGPTQATAQMESSKEFAKEFMHRHGIPTATAKSFNDFQMAKEYVQQHSYPLVIKADGLAGGKGVTIATNYSQAVVVLESLLGSSTESQVLIEEYLSGEEYSMMLLVGGDEYVQLPLAQDHKRLLNGDSGPNTGGMGAYSPVPQISQQVINETIQTIVEPTLTGLKQDKLSFAGVMYVGLMLTATGPKVIEYNMRLGDPETQVLLPQLKSDFYEIIASLIAYQKPVVEWQTKDSYFGVVLAAPGYPTAPVDYIPVPSINSQDIYYAGIQQVDGQYYSHGGRVLMITAHAKSLLAAQQQVYQLLAQIDTKLIYRTDIGYRGIQYLQRNVKSIN